MQASEKQEVAIALGDFWLVQYPGDVELHPVKIIRFYDDRAITEIYDEGGKPSTKFYESDDLIWRFKMATGEL